MRQLPLDLSVPVRPTLDNFVPGANLEAIDSVRMLLRADRPAPVLYLWGPESSGRTHLLCAAADAAGGRYCDSQHALPGHAAALMAFDDVDRFDPPAQHRAFALINEVLEQSGVVVAAGSAPPAGLAVREDLRTRLGWGLVYQLKPLTDDDKATYLTDEASRRGLQLGPGVVAYLLNRLPRDLGSLARVVAMLDQHSLARQRQVTLPLVREALSVAGLAPRPGRG